MSRYKIGFGNLTPVVKYLLFINVGIYLAMVISPSLGTYIYKYLFLHYPGSETFVATQFVTCMFVHFPNFYVLHPETGQIVILDWFSKHLLFNMIALWVFGGMVEMVWRSKRFLNFYLFSGLGASVINVVVMYIMHGEAHAVGVMGGASGAIYGVMVAAAYLFPNNTVYIYFLLPIKIKYLVILLIGIDLVMGLSGRYTGTAHWAHLGGALVGLIFCYGGNLRKWMR